MKSGVYRIRNTSNAKCYIGSSIELSVRFDVHQRQLRNHCHHSIALQRAWNKYGANAFVFEILLYCDPKNCLMYEQIAMDCYKPEYNISLVADNPMTGRRHSTQTKDKMSRSHRGHKVTVNTKRKIRLAQQGSKGNNAKLTEELVQEIRSRLAVGGNQIMIANEYGVSAPTITDIKNRKSWRHVL